MGVDIVKEFLDRLYPWHYHVAGGIIIAALGAFFWYTFVGVNKFTKSVSSILAHDEKMQELRVQIDSLKEQNNNNKTIANYVSRVIYNIKPYIDALNEIRILSSYRLQVAESAALIQRALDSLTSDIKYKSGEHHRCCIWVLEDRHLQPTVVSAGFPSNYKATRLLERDKSIAGRAFRTKQTQNIDDVTKDTEWVKNADSRSNYRSLICVPIGEVGVLTIDGIEPMSAECQYIAELYASVIEGAIQEYFMATAEQQSQFGIDNEDEVV